MRYRANSIRNLARLRHVETTVSAGKPPPMRQLPYPRSKTDPAAKNPRIEVGELGGRRRIRTLWTRST
jgi:hypothetical protein